MNFSFFLYLSLFFLFFSNGMLLFFFGCVCLCFFFFVFMYVDKSMNDPLFRADKTLIRLQGLVPANDKQAQSEYQDALDLFVEKAEEGNGMAFISSWGEANPGGGKDRVALFIERSKKDVIDAKDALTTVKRILKI